jgi:hypothetical protein
MIFAIATAYSVIIYSTESLKPLYGMGNFHFAALTDLSWKDDRMLAISSSDGYISFFTFDKGELGEHYEPEEGALKELVKREKYVKKVETEAERMERMMGQGEVVQQEQRI